MQLPYFKVIRQESKNTGMDTLNIENLNKKYSIKNEYTELSFESGQGGIPVVNIKNRQATASISVQGAHLLSWIPAGADDVIWLSADATFAPGKSIRGGIPVCWPWFGAHENNKDYPAHGFARTELWQVTATQSISADETQITFTLDTNQRDSDKQAMWPWPTTVEYSLIIAKTLSLEVKTTNLSGQTITIGQALHTYFSIHDINHTTVTGLEGKEYLDKTDGFKRKQQIGPITIDSEVDRVYLETPDDVVVDDTKRKITIKKRESQTTIVWNPWKDVAEKMGDLGENGYLNMLCVESANAAQDTVSLAAGESHSLRVTYAIE
ncbi:MAG: D-hexose-6-phosphate mutarotase [Thiohalomonadales bacterium]